MIGKSHQKPKITPFTSFHSKAKPFFLFPLLSQTSAFTDSSTLKRMLKPMPSTESPVTSPEMSRRKYSHYSNTGTNTMHSHQHGMHNFMNNNNVITSRPPSQASRFSGSRSSHEIGRGYQQQRDMFLDLGRERGCVESSPPSDNVIFDNQCYATTPSSSNGNSDQDQPQQYGTASRQGSRHAHHHQVRPCVVSKRRLIHIKTRILF